jgi:peroxiredoxin
MPALNRLHYQILSSGGTVLGVSVDDDEAKYEKFLAEYKITFPNYRDPSRGIAASYGSTMYPETYVLSRDGKIARKIIGPHVWDSPEMIAYVKRVAAQ